MSEPKQPPKAGETLPVWERVNGGEDLSRIMNTLQRIQQTGKSPPPVSKPSPPPSGPAQK
jgi:hypothetical protein